MVIDTIGRVWAFTVSTTLVALVFALSLNFVLFPDDIVGATLRGTAIIVPLVAMPICFWVGRQMHEKALMAAQLQALVDRDRLTDVATRDFFFARLTESPDAYGVSLMVDIDHFKRVNDTYGHLAGDDVIQAVAFAMRNQMREDDIVCRFGGEEFMIFLFDATPQEGWTIAERIRSSIEAAPTGTVAGDVNVTVSVGGSMKDQVDHVDDAIKRADDCLYQAKKLGRNRTVVDWGTAGEAGGANVKIA